MFNQIMETRNVFLSLRTNFAYVKNQNFKTMKTKLLAFNAKRNAMLCIISMIVLSLALTNCKSSNEFVIKPETTKIKGALGDYYEVVNNEYKIINDDESFDSSATISISIKRKGGDLPFDINDTLPFGTNGGKSTHIGFGIELLDDNSNSIDVKQATADGLAGVYSSDDITNLMQLKDGETGTIRWSIDKELLSKIKSFRITSAMEKDHSISDAQASLDGTSDNYTEDITNNESIDQLLDSYEQYMIEYAQLSKNVESGSVGSSMESYSDLMTKQAELSEKLSNIQGSMTMEQAARFAKIQANVMSSMSN